MIYHPNDNVLNIVYVIYEHINNEIVQSPEFSFITSNVKLVLTLPGLSK